MIRKSAKSLDCGTRLHDSVYAVLKKHVKFAKAAQIAKHRQPSQSVIIPDHPAMHLTCEEKEMIEEYDYVIELIGIDAYHEWMCRIEEEIQEELREEALIRLREEALRSTYDEWNDEILLEEGEDRISIVCPGCRRSMLQENRNCLCCICGWMVHLASAQSSHCLQPHEMKMAFADFFDRHRDHCETVATCKSCDCHLQYVESEPGILIITSSCGFEGIFDW